MEVVEIYGVRDHKGELVSHGISMQIQYTQHLEKTFLTVWEVVVG